MGWRSDEREPRYRAILSPLLRRREFVASATYISLMSLVQTVRNYPRVFCTRLPSHLDAIVAFAERGIALQESFSFRANNDLLVRLLSFSDLLHLTPRIDVDCDGSTNSNGLGLLDDIPANDPTSHSRNHQEPPSRYCRFSEVSSHASERGTACVCATIRGRDSLLAQDPVVDSSFPNGES